MNDTTPGAAAAARAAMLRSTSVERMERSFAFSEQMRELSLAALRPRHPHLTTLQLVELLVGESLVPSSRTPPSALG